jgi:(2Fe-2S) ferredoxin
VDRGPESGVSSGALGAVAETPAEGKKLVFVCVNVDCRVRGASEVMERLDAGVKQACTGGESSACGNAEVRPYMCFGGCHDGPNVIVYPDRVWYAGVKPEDADTIVEDHLKKGEVVKPLTGKIDQGLQDMIFNLLDFGIY